jgi:hypothetical protein
MACKCNRGCLRSVRKMQRVSNIVKPVITSIEQNQVQPTRLVESPEESHVRRIHSLNNKK